MTRLSASEFGLVLVNRALRLVAPTRLVRQKWKHGDLVVSLIDDKRSQTPEIVYTEIRHGEYDPPVPLNPGDVVLDFGAHVGGFALWLALQNPQVSFICVEPNLKNYQNLVRNIAENFGRAGRLPNVVPVWAGVWDDSGKTLVPLFHHRTNTGGSHTTEGEGGCPSYTVNGLLDKFGIDNVRLLKIDVEGAEFKAVRSVGDLARVSSILAEIHDAPGRDTRGMIRLLSVRPGILQVLWPEEGRREIIRNGVQ